MTRHRFHIEITEQNRPYRAIVTVQPRTVEHHPVYFARDEHALEFADRLAREHGWRIVDRRQSKAA